MIRKKHTQARHNLEMTLPLVMLPPVIVLRRALQLIPLAVQIWIGFCMIHSRTKREL